MKLSSAFLVIFLTASPAFAAGWQVNDTVSPLDGSRSYAAQLSSTNTIHVASGDQPAILIVRCAGGVLDSYIVWPQILGTGPLDMRWHADAGAPNVQVWTVSPGQTATFSENPRALLAALKSARSATFQVSLADFTSLQASFDLTGLGPIAAAATSACRS